MNNYFNNLKEYLEEKEINKNQIEEIINDYKEFYEEYLKNGLTDEEITIKLGSPKEIYQSLKGTFVKEQRPAFQNKIVSLSPFIAVIIYVLLGYFLDAWHPAWVVFLLTPLTAVLFNQGRLLKRVTESLIFVGIMLAFLVVHFKWLEWKYAWLFFIVFLIPSIFAYNNQTKLKAIISEASLVIAIILYIVLVFLKVSVPIALLSFLLPLIVLIYAGYIEVGFDIKKGIKRIIVLTSFLISLVLFIVFGLMFSNWAYFWQILLLPFMITILVENKPNNYLITALMPFLATIIFYSLGYFYGAWAVSWLAYLLIPLTAILEGKPVVEIKETDNN
ncbi:MAG: DUF1700 domain-containing protein [Acholeplasmataceae bacterium]|nr:DUF1700 domain-containing protein [Acholeplasmataceae bacterium]MCK9289687.1 DUF1700 domain-containing protein [Acholeplasmataceae bacterium]